MINFQLVTSKAIYSVLPSFQEARRPNKPSVQDFFDMGMTKRNIATGHTKFLNLLSWIYGQAC